MSFIKNINIVYYSLSCTSMLQTLDLGIRKCFKKNYKKHLVQKSVCLMGSGGDAKLKVTVLQVIHFTTVAWHCHAVNNHELFF
jgi:hypothetical protein